MWHPSVTLHTSICCAELPKLSVVLMCDLYNTQQLHVYGKIINPPNNN